MSAARVFYSLKSSRCVESYRVKVSAQPLHVFSNVIESDQRAEEHARADQLGNTSTRISHDIGSLRHSLDRTGDSSMHKSREAHRQGVASSARRKTLQHRWLISPAWRYALSTFDLLEEEQRRSLARTGERIDDLKE